MSKILEALAVLAEITGTDWSKPTIRVIEQELLLYPERDVLLSIRRCQTELRSRVTLADILDRIPNQQPGVEEAWSLISKAINNEQISICITEEMREAFGAAAALAGDRVAARLAFRERYIKLVSEARAMRKPITWVVSLGWDKAQREECVRAAAEKNLISQQQATALIGHPLPTQEAVKLLQQHNLHTKNL